MNQNQPCVSVGIPVYNGERFLAQSIESILSQTFRDFELIISDNASTDATGEICKRYAQSDSRVRYCRSEQNRGAAWNHNHLIEIARGEFFKWQCHDDYSAPTFIEKCLSVLREDPTAVLCYPQFIRVDENGRKLGSVMASRVEGQADTYNRYKSIIYRRDSCEEIYGITRTAILRKTALIGPYSNSDDTFLAELILHGTFKQVWEPLFYYRVHSAQSTHVFPCRTARMIWFDTSSRVAFSFPFIRLFKGYLSLLWRSPLPAYEKIRCYCAMVGWFWYFRHWLGEDIRASRSLIIYNWIAPPLKRYAPWTGAAWQWTKSVKRRCRLPESLAAREKRLRRERVEHWDLTPRD